LASPLRFLLEVFRAKMSVMEGFTTHRGSTAVYLADDVDTDRIIPARFLSRVSRSGYGELLFKDVRGEDFPLDREQAQGASVLVVGTNFGCGSSREHAVWAIQQAGFRAVIARRTETSAGYSDIFRSNAGNCGLLLIELEEAAHEKLVAAGSGQDVEIDLPNQTVRVAGESLRFEISEGLKNQLIQGLDLVGTTLEHEQSISQFENEWDSFKPANAAK
jgi:3-isopropylmalate/(R)-2-methylmalate dehydratase small subunit